jgi:hypothetical protein
MRFPRPQFRLSTLLWITLAVGVVCWLLMGQPWWYVLALAVTCIVGAIQLGVQRLCDRRRRQALSLKTKPMKVD